MVSQALARKKCYRVPFHNRTVGILGFCLCEDQCCSNKKAITPNNEQYMPNTKKTSANFSSHRMCSFRFPNVETTMQMPQSFSMELWVRGHVPQIFCWKGFAIFRFKDGACRCLENFSGRLTMFANKDADSKRQFRRVFCPGHFWPMITFENLR